MRESFAPSFCYGKGMFLWLLIGVLLIGHSDTWLNRTDFCISIFIFFVLTLYCIEYVLLSIKLKLHLSSVINYVLILIKVVLGIEREKSALWWRKRNHWTSKRKVKRVCKSKTLKHICKRAGHFAYQLYWYPEIDQHCIICKL